MNILRLTLLTADLEGTKHFYHQKLGLEIVEEKADAVCFRAGASLVQFQLAEGQPVYHFAFNIPQNKIDEALQWCLATGLQMLPFQNNNLVDFPNWNAHSVYFSDNNGSILEFIARHDLANAVDGSFNAGQLVCVSEIGLVVEDVLLQCKILNAQYGIPYYEKQKPAPDFSVMGDANGLLIVVPKSRKWFPTQVVSAVFPLQVNFGQNGKEFHLSF